MAEAELGQASRWAYGVDPSRPQRYSLRQARYDAIARDISDWAGAASARGERLSVLDIGCAWGVLLCHLQAKPHFASIAISAADVVDSAVGKERYQRFVVGDLRGGYPELPSAAYDVVVCEQVLEHLDELDAALATLHRLVKPGGRLVIGVPIFLPPLHLVRRHVLPLLFKLIPLRRLGTHDQAFSLASFRRRLRALPGLRVQTVRGFRVISGGLLAPLENYRWWWRFNRRLGELLPAACIEVQIILAKTGA